MSDWPLRPVRHIAVRAQPIALASMDHTKLGKLEQQLLASSGIKVDGCLGILTHPLNPGDDATTKALMFDDRTLMQVGSRSRRASAIGDSSFHPAPIAALLKLSFKRRGKRVDGLLGPVGSRNLGFGIGHKLACDGTGVLHAATPLRILATPNAASCIRLVNLVIILPRKASRT